MKYSLTLLLALPLAVAACQSANEAPSTTPNAIAPTIDPIFQAEIDQEWAVCVICHGSTGKGNGRASRNLKTKPRSFGRADWQEATTDADLRFVIVEGGAAVGLSGLMPGSTRLAKKPQVVDGLVAKVRSFKP